MLKRVLLAGVLYGGICYSKQVTFDLTKNTTESTIQEGLISKEDLKKLRSDSLNDEESKAFYDKIIQEKRKHYRSKKYIEDLKIARIYEVLNRWEQDINSGVPANPNLYSKTLRIHLKNIIDTIGEDGVDPYYNLNVIRAQLSTYKDTLYEEKNSKIKEEILANIQKLKHQLYLYL